MKFVPTTVILIIGAVAAPFTAAMAQTAGPAELSEIASCRDVSKAKDRLRCFDRTTKVLEMSMASTTMAGEENNKAGASAYDGAENVKQEEKRSELVAGFGAEDLVVQDADKQLKELRATATEIAKDRRGKLVITLDNGQVWRQLSSDIKTLRVRKDKDRDGHDVILKKRSLGAYTLRLTTAKRSILVRRVK